MLTEAYLEPSRTSTMELFSLRLSHILKTYSIGSNCLKVPFFTHLTLSWKNLQLWKLWEKKSFVNNGSFFFRNSKLRNVMAPSINRSSHRRCSVRKVVLRNFAKFTGKYMYHSLSFNKVSGPRPATLIKKRLWHRCFPVNFAKFFRTTFLQNTSGRLLLNKKVF